MQIIDETGAGERPPFYNIEWPSLLEFLTVAKGLAPMDKPLAHEFISNKIKNTNDILKHTDEVVEWLVDYDNVMSQEIRVL